MYWLPKNSVREDSVALDFSSMNYLRRAVLLTVLSGSLAFAQTEAPVASSTAASATERFINTDAPAELLVVANGARPEPLPNAPANGNFLLRSALVTPAPSEPVVSARQRELWYGLMAAEHSAATLDAWSTRQALQTGRSKELDPLVRPFAHSGVLYPALQVAPFGMDYLASRLMHSGNRKLQRLWWVPQVAATAGSLLCASSNLAQHR